MSTIQEGARIITEPLTGATEHSQNLRARQIAKLRRLEEESRQLHVRYRDVVERYSIVYKERGVLRTQMAEVEQQLSRYPTPPKRHYHRGANLRPRQEAPPAPDAWTARPIHAPWAQRTFEVTDPRTAGLQGNQESLARELARVEAQAAMLESERDRLSGEHQTLGRIIQNGRRFLGLNDNPGATYRRASLL